MIDKAKLYNKQGLRLFRDGQLQEAIDFFTKAINIDPQFPDAYQNRGGVLLQINRIIEANTDIQMAKDLRSAKFKGISRGKSGEKNNNKPVRLNWLEVDCIYDNVYPDDSQDTENDAQEFDDSFYDDFFSSDTIETEEAREGFVKPASETSHYPAIIEFINGKTLEVARARLFEPTKNDISIIRQDGHVERVIPLEHITCIRNAEIPSKLTKDKNSSCHVEIIETVDGKIYNEAIHPEQDIENVLFGFSTSEQTRFIYSFLPVVNIKKRCQHRYLGEILMEKQFIGDEILKHALDKHQQTKSMKLGKIIALRAKVNCSVIEEELEQAKQAKVQEGLKTGEILLTAGLVDEKQVSESLKYQECLQNMKIGQFLIKKGIVQEKEVFIALAEKFRIPFVDLGKQKISRKALKLLSKKFVLQNEFLPISLDNERLTVATKHPDVSRLYDAVIKESKCKDVQFVLTLPSQLRSIINLLNKKIGFGLDH